MVGNYEPLCGRCGAVIKPEEGRKKFCETCDGRGKKKKFLNCTSMKKEPYFDIKNGVGIWKKRPHPVCTIVKDAKDVFFCDVNRMKKCTHYVRK